MLEANGTYKVKNSERNTAELHHYNDHFILRTTIKKIAKDLERHCKIGEIPLNKEVKIHVKKHGCAGHFLVTEREVDKIELTDEGDKLQFVAVDRIEE